MSKRTPAIFATSPDSLSSIEIGAAFKARRKACKQTLNDVAMLTGITKKTIIRFEKGGDVRFSTMSILLGLYGLSIGFTKSAQELLKAAERGEESVEADWY